MSLVHNRIGPISAVHDATHDAVRSGLIAPPFAHFQHVAHLWPHFGHLPRHSPSPSVKPTSARCATAVSEGHGPHARGPSLVDSRTTTTVPSPVPYPTTVLPQESNGATTAAAPGAGGQSSSSTQMPSGKRPPTLILRLQGQKDSAPLTLRANTPMPRTHHPGETPRPVARARTLTGAQAARGHTLQGPIRRPPRLAALRLGEAGYNKIMGEGWHSTQPFRPHPHPRSST